MPMFCTKCFIGFCGFVGIVGFLISSLAWGQDQGELGFHFSFDGQFRYGNISGFVQVPRGGGAGTTSNERPKFDELGINHAAIGDPSVTVGWNDHNLYGGASIIRLSGSNTLSTALISNGTTFPAGSSVNADVQLDWYRFGYEYRFAYKYSQSSVLSFYPAVGVALFNFDYNLKGVNGLSAARSFEKAAPQLGLTSEWNPEGRFSLSGGVFSSLAFSTLPLLLSVNLTGGYQLWGSPEHGGIAYLGIGYDRIDEEDNQKVSNHIRASIGPEVVVGLKLRF
jgi:hypothetical protein